MASQGHTLKAFDEDLDRLGGFLASTAGARTASQETVRRRLWHRMPWLAVGLAGALASAATPAETAAVRAYAKNLGLAFQIVDDLIDVTGLAAEAGKDVRQDLKKTTFVSFSGVEGAAQLARELAQASQEALRPFGARARELRELAQYVVARRR